MLMFASTMLTTESSTLGLPDFPVTNLPEIARILVSPDEKDQCHTVLNPVNIDGAMTFCIILQIRILPV